MIIGYHHPELCVCVFIDGKNKTDCKKQLQVLCRQRGWKIGGWEEMKNEWWEEMKNES